MDSTLKYAFLILKCTGDAKKQVSKHEKTTIGVLYYYYLPQCDYVNG